MIRRLLCSLMLPIALVWSAPLSLSAPLTPAPNSPALRSHHTDSKAAGQQKTEPLAARFATMEKRLRKEAADAHVVGESLVIVKDGKIIYLKGFGFRDLAQKKPVTPDTLFAIGSSSKAFTAMTMMMSLDEGKVDLTDSPHKYLPYFKLKDPDTDAKITISDLMCHRSGLPRTDLAWSTGKLSSEEVIRVACEAKPTAKLGEKFQYQNVMFLAAGQIVAAVQHKPWSQVVAERIFHPLGMARTETSVARMQADPDHSLGYAWDEDKSAPYRLPMRNLECIAPAGAINSSAREMSGWIELMLDRGMFRGKRLVSEKSFAELSKKRIDVAGNVGYGYGWFLRDWHGHGVMEHGGNIDGFSAQVALMPDQKLGFALLTNANATSAAPQSMETVFSSLIGVPKKAEEVEAPGPAVEPSAEAGTYRLEAAPVDAKVEFRDNGLTLTVPGQPTYKLAHESGRKYRLEGLSGYTATFRASKADPKKTQMVIVQPEGTFIANRVEASGPEPPYTGPLKELVGIYENEMPHVEFNVAAQQGKVCLIVPGQPAYPLVASGKGKDQYRLGSLPETFGITVKRDAAGKVIGMELMQPQGNLHLTRELDAPGLITGDVLMSKMLEAIGGEAALRKHHAMRISIHSNMENEGVQADSVEYFQAPLSNTRTTEILALGKNIASMRTYFNGKSGGTESTLSPARPFGKKELARAGYNADMYALADWKNRFKSVEVRRTAKLGAEDVFVVVMTPVDPLVPPTTDYVSTGSFLVLKSETSEITEIGAIPVTVTFNDYRDTDGVKIAYHRAEEAMGATTVDTVTNVEFDTDIPAAVFAPAAKP